MQNISKIADRLNSYGRPNRVGLSAIQHQIVFIRTAPLGEEDFLDNNHGNLSEQALRVMMATPEFKGMVETVSLCYELNVANAEEQFFAVKDFKMYYDRFRIKHNGATMFPGGLPELSDARIEIRPAQVFSQNVYYFVKSKEDLHKVEEQFRALLADNDLPAETVNLSFTALSSVEIDCLYSLMALFSLVLRESAKDTMFIPGRVIGTFNQITKAVFYGA